MSLSFDPRAGLIVVPTRLSGPSGETTIRLALDTGATGTMVNSDLLVLIGYDPALSSERVQVTTGSGIEFAPRIAVNKVEALGRERNLLPVLSHTLPPSATVDGVLGLDFFRGHRLTIDFRSGVVLVE